MKRTQIYPDEDTYYYLKKESAVKHLSVSEVIRYSIREKMNRKIQKIMRATEKVSGIWKNKEIDVDRHVRALRKGRKA